MGASAPGSLAVTHASALKKQDAQAALGRQAVAGDGHGVECASRGADKAVHPWCALTCGPPKPLKAVLEAMWVRQMWPRARKAGQRYTQSACIRARSMTPWLQGRGWAWRVCVHTCGGGGGLKPGRRMSTAGGAVLQQAGLHKEERWRKTSID